MENLKYKTIMKNFIKFLFVGIMCILSTNSYSQTIGFKAGLNLSNLDSYSNHGQEGSNEYYSYSLKPNSGFLLGATVEFPLTKLFSLETGLLLTTKGYKYNFTYDDYINRTTSDSKTNAKFYYIELPLNVKATFDFGKTKPYGILGPYIGYLFGKSYKSETTMNGETNKINSGFIWVPGGNSRIDFGLNIGIGIAINAVQFGVTYSLGLAKSMSNPGNGYEAKNRVLGINIGYNLLKK